MCVGVCGCGVCVCVCVCVCLWVCVCVGVWVCGCVCERERLVNCVVAWINCVQPRITVCTDTLLVSSRSLVHSRCGPWYLEVPQRLGAGVPEIKKEGRQETPQCYLLHLGLRGTGDREIAHMHL